MLLLLTMSGILPPSLAAAQSQAGSGLARIELSSYFESQPLSVTPHALPAAMPIRLDEITNASWMTEELHLDDNARQAVARNGFVVVPYGPEMDMIAPYKHLPTRGVPNFITSDSLLHLYHVQFDEILKNVEVKEFLPRLTGMSRSLFENAQNQYQAYTGDLKEAARRNVAFFTVALKLLGEPASVPDYVLEAVTAELSKIGEHAGFNDSPIFIYKEDYSQYVPRGHYTRSDELKKYFKAMMWYARMSFLLKGSASSGPAGDALISVEDARIQTLQASLITLGLDSLQSEGQSIADIWNRIYGVTAFFVGLADDLTPYEYKEAIQKILGAPVNVAALADPATLFELKKELASLRSPQIFGGTGNAMVPPNATAEDLDKILDKTKGMRLMGQRFIPDSYMFQKLVLPVVRQHTTTGNPFTLVVTQMGPARGFPRGLDVMAVLGSDVALSILDREGDTDYVDYDQSLNELMGQFRSLSEADWTRNLYWAWLYALQPLLADCGEGYPAFMRSAAWQDKQLHTALASWTELRHDTILYAKQSYTPVVTSIPPVPPPPDRGYVEPVPEFFHRLLALTRMTRAGLAAMNVLDAAQTSRLNLLEEVLGRLVAISLAELEGHNPSEEDYEFIERFGLILAPLGEGLSDTQARQTALVADVHTDGNTQQVLEEGVGYVKLIIAAYPIPEGRVVLGAGPVFSYYEFKWLMNDRLTDEKWTNMLFAGNQPSEPRWVRSFMHPVSLPPDDTDGDRLPDTWETALWGSISAVNDPAGDFDGDGFSNEQEFRAGTNPRDAASFLQVVSSRSTPGGLHLRWNGVQAKRYRVFYSDDLINWNLLQTPVIAEGAMAGLLDPGASNTRQRFYRVKVVP